MKKLILSLMLVTAFAVGCKKEDPRGGKGRCGTGEEICMQRAGTQCADPWGNPEKFRKEAAIKNYLEDQGINVSSVTVKFKDPGIVCLACQCPSGEMVFIKVNAEDKAKAEAEGFEAGDCDAESKY